MTQDISGTPNSEAVSGIRRDPKNTTNGAPKGSGFFQQAFEKAAALGKPTEFDISDPFFMQDLAKLRELRSFLIREAVKLNSPDKGCLSFGELNLLRYKNNGRAPNENEWAQVEFHTQSLFSLLTDPLRRRFILGGIPWWASGLPLVFAAIALISLLLVFVILYVFYVDIAPGVLILPFYLIWLMSLGAMGAIAFVGMNFLSVQEDVTFDLTNTRLMVLRISLGALFGLVLTLPFGFQDFVAFRDSIAAIGGFSHEPGDTSTSGVTKQALMLLLPFILGFSTSLVILVLNRFVEAVQGFFGKPSGGIPAKPGSNEPPISATPPAATILQAPITPKP